MSIQPQALNSEDHESILCLCVLAAFSDGEQSEVERAQIERIVSGFPGERLDLSSAYQEVLEGKLSLAQLAAGLKSPAARALAYEMAVCVCNADGVLTDSERQFLSELRRALQLEGASTEVHQQAAQQVAAQPLTSSVPPVLNGSLDSDLDHVILNAAILNGALEIMPHTLATMAIVPLQMRMVYQIGKRFGFELDRGHIKDFLGVVGIGMGSQVFEGYARHLIGGLARGLAGGLLGGLAGQATGSAFAFGTTYALGQVAKRYYASGRTLSASQLKEVFASMLEEARSVQGRHSQDIITASRQVNLSELVPLVSSK